MTPRGHSSDCRPKRINTIVYPESKAWLWEIKIYDLGVNGDESLGHTCFLAQPVKSNEP
jgi:hypothetical protein